MGVYGNVNASRVWKGVLCNNEYVFFKYFLQREYFFLLLQFYAKLGLKYY